MRASELFLPLIVLALSLSGCVVSLGDRTGFLEAKERLFSGGIGNITEAYEEIIANAHILPNGTMLYNQKTSSLTARTAAFHIIKLIEPLYSCVWLDETEEVCPHNFKDFSDFERRKFAVSIVRKPEQVENFAGTPFLSVGWKRGKILDFSFSSNPDRETLMKIGANPKNVFNYNESRKEINSSVDFGANEDGFCAYLGIIPRRRTSYIISSDLPLSNFSLSSTEGISAFGEEKALRVLSDAGDPAGDLQVVEACFSRKPKTEED